ncbi:pentapeptide repeat-containing protein [Tessaracoccus antarcticus]|uniref:Pentapeptide repeat-containing protein n=1 Tax=Tessaracoccus antarcticus TaxID=2479848 RepID=A0A3M0GJS3_9ACTN|nr:pentapeptide repeat-containing protein [Tessaracoccus antarcticus]RMB61379.1 pentapeptide repeat-containing protein [Tessaracoccus antarcticus]
MPAAPSVPSPRIDPLVLENLFDGEPDLLGHGADLDALRFAGIRSERVDLKGSTILGCEFEDVVADEFSVATSRLSETRFARMGVTLLRMARSVLRDVEFDGGRLGAVEAYDLQGKAVHFRGCRLNYLNLRGSKLADVAFTDCQIDELDLGQATAQRVQFAGTRIGILSLHGGTFTDVDLRGAGLEVVNGASSLRGATISPEQLVGLGPQLAEEAGIRVASTALLNQRGAVNQR